MSPETQTLLDLAVRWVHVIAAIMWVGNSLLFNFLDRVLRPSSKPGEGMQGDLWLIHSGGFYFLEKTLLVGQPLPRPLHWFKWQAYTTWWSGAVLLVLVYYVSGRSLLVGGAHPDLSPWYAIAIGVGAIVATWLIYETLWSFVYARSPKAAATLSIVGLVALVWALTHLLSGRAAFLHVGAALGTLMAWNVVHVVMPSQRALVRAVEEGRGSDKVIAERAKTRSIHNNYLVFPVVVLMLSSHFPLAYGHPLNWALLLILIAAGAAVRHVMNIRFGYRNWKAALTATVVIAILSLYAVLRFGSGPDAARPAAGSAAAPVPFEDARHIIDRRCATCHSQDPSDLSFGPMPGGVAFDTPEQIRALAPRILERAVVTRTMPPGNKTHISDAELEILRRWVEAGAR